MAGARGIRAGKAYVELGVSDKLTRGLRRAQRRLQAFAAGVRSLGMSLTKIGAGLATPLAASVKVFASMGDKIEKMSRRTGIGAEALSEMGFAAEQSGTNLETLEKGVRTLQRSINDAGRGLATAKDALNDLSLSFEDLQGLTPEQQFKLVADRLAGITDPSKRAAVAMQLLGRAGTQLLPMMENGAQGIEDLQKQARALGLTISSDAARSAAKLTDTLNVLWRVVKQGVFVIGSALAGSVEDLVGSVVGVVVRVSDWIKQNRELTVWVAKVAAVVLGAGIALLTIGGVVAAASAALGGFATAVSAAGTVLGAMATALSAMLSPIGLVVAAVAGLGAALVAYTGAGGEALDWLSTQFERLRKFVGEVVGGIVDALAAGDVALAAEVMWAGLKVAWETGIKPLRRIWNDFRYALERTGINAFAGLRKAWANVSNWMWKNFPETTAFLARTWANLTGVFKRVWARFQNWLSDRWLEIMAWFDEDLDVEAAKALGRQDLNSQLKQIEADRQAAIAEAERKAGRTDAEREAEHAAALAEIEAERVRALAELDSAYADRVAAAEQALNKAKDKLAQARKKARQERETAAGRQLARPTLAAVVAETGAVVDQAKARISMTGTFNPAALFGLGTSSPIERTARAAEETAKNTKRLVNEGRLAFS